MLIDTQWNINHLACYSTELLNRLYDHPHTLLEVLTRQDGEWTIVPARDRLWVFWKAADKETINKVLEKIITRAITNHALHCGIPQVEEWAKNWLNGTDRTAANAAAHTAHTAYAACAAAANAAYAAHAAHDAAYAAGTVRATAAYAAGAARAAVFAASANRAIVFTASANRAIVFTETAQQDEYNKQLQDAIDVLTLKETN